MIPSLCLLTICHLLVKESIRGFEGFSSSLVQDAAGRICKSRSPGKVCIYGTIGHFSATDQSDVVIHVQLLRTGTDLLLNDYIEWRSSSVKGCGAVALRWSSRRLRDTLNLITQ